MNCGQKCLLQGLISASKDQKQNAYKEGLQKTTWAITKGKDFRSTLGQLFNKQMSHQEVDEGLVPGPSHTASGSLPQKRKIKGKGKYPAKGPIKKKSERVSIKSSRFNENVFKDSSWCCKGSNDKKCLDT